MPQAGDFDLIEAALGGGRKVKPNVKPSDLAEPALSEALLDSRVKTGTSGRATRRSRTGDLLITNSHSDQTEENHEELSPRKIDDPE